MEIRDCNPFFVLSFVYYVPDKTHYTMVALCMYIYDVFYVVIYFAEINLSIYLPQKYQFVLIKHKINC